MIRKELVVSLSIIVPALFAGHRVYAQSDNAVLHGSYTLNTMGSALLSAPTSGTCQASGTVPASISDTSWIFDGRGRVAASTFGWSIGATDCPNTDFVYNGAYTVDEVGDRDFHATGIFTITYVGFHGETCTGMGLTNVPFALVGTLDTAGNATSFNITTQTPGSGAYAEGPPAFTSGPTTCTANILNFITSGTGRKVKG